MNATTIGFYEQVSDDLLFDGLLVISAQAIALPVSVTFLSCQPKACWHDTFFIIICLYFHLYNLCIVDKKTLPGTMRYTLDDNKRILEMPKSTELPPDEVSKSSLKRDMTALQKIGETLVKLPQSQLDKIPVPDKLLEAVNHARSLKTRESIRRQLQYIGKVIRDIDTAPIQEALRLLQLTNARATQDFHELENWRERLIKEGDDAIQIYLADHPQADRQKLRQLVRKAQHDRKQEKDTGGTTELFRYLKTIAS